MEKTLLFLKDNFFEIAYFVVFMALAFTEMYFTALMMLAFAVVLLFIMAEMNANSAKKIALVVEMIHELVKKEMPKPEPELKVHSGPTVNYAIPDDCPMNKDGVPQCVVYGRRDDCKIKDTCEFSKKLDSLRDQAEEKNK